MNRKISIYVHIPFCERKCKYCAFNSFCADDSFVEKYLSQLEHEIESRKIDACVKTIYIGGGTPSVLTENQIERVFKAIRKNFQIDADAEITLEANPNSISEAKLAKWRKLGVNRLSIGVQSLSDDSLRKIGRLHTRKEAIEKVGLAKRYFENISCDFIVGLENENGERLCEYARELLGLGVKHISCYMLEIYPNTPLEKMIAWREYVPLSDEQTIDAFNLLTEYLEKCGFERYEISNFAQKGFESRHNLNYWERGEFLGFGLSAHSFLDGKRVENSDNFAAYSKGEQKVNALTLSEADEEKIMLGLRCKNGVDLSTLSSKKILENPFYKEYLKSGVLNKCKNVLTLNPKFWNVSNTIISNLF